MKKLFKVFTLVFAMSLFANANLFGQSGVVKLNILSPIVSTLNLSYEHIIDESKSFQLGFFYTGLGFEGTNFSGIGITPEFRLYLGDNDAPDGFYVGPFLRYTNLKLTSDDATGSATFSGFGGGLVVGRQWLFSERVTLDVFLGPRYTSTNLKVEDGTTNPDQFETGIFSGFGLRSGITLGFAF